MRRNANGLLAVSLMMLAGCGLFKKQPGMESMSYNDVGMGSLVVSANEPAFDVEPYPAYGASGMGERLYEPSDTSTLAAGSSPRNHTVVRHDTLYQLARTYYNDHRRWKDIYEANRSVVSDPNKIRVGQRLVIP